MKNVLNIIYEDDDILAINKPAGVLVDSAAEKYPQAVLAHRLDKDTSGVLLLAKNQETYDYLKNEFKNRKIKKTYLALVEGAIKEKDLSADKAEGRIDFPIGRSKKDFRRRISIGKQVGKTRLPAGKVREALTLYKVKKRFPGVGLLGKGYALVEVFPQTGRTHQIRSHFKAIGHPIVCDQLYGSRRSVGKECPFGLTRQFLHALSLELTLPNGTRLKLEADLPEELEKALKIAERGVL